MVEKSSVIRLQVPILQRKSQLFIWEGHDESTSSTSHETFSKLYTITHALQEELISPLNGLTGSKNCCVMLMEGHQHTFREGNFSADILTKFGVNHLHQLTVLDTPILEIDLNLLWDRLEVF
ncbi:hypothetical protein VNO77_03433 [Canavalia gladiata]|uniref:Uncharacterized protein n=1 Tax=Canavalia gladiata TaxID=3824 RepID=A0AAN9MVC6_CANGL